MVGGALSLRPMLGYPEASTTGELVLATIGATAITRLAIDNRARRAARRGAPWLSLSGRSVTGLDATMDAAILPNAPCDRSPTVSLPGPGGCAARLFRLPLVVCRHRSCHDGGVQLVQAAHLRGEPAGGENLGGPRRLLVAGLHQKVATPR